MPSYYYADMYYQGEFGPVVRGVIDGMLVSGSRFKKANIQESPESKSHHSFTGTSSLNSFIDMSQAYIENMLARGLNRIPFPSWGRIVFDHDFDFDEDFFDEVMDEENESKTSALDIGVSFVYTDDPKNGIRRTQATFSLWEDFVLTGIGNQRIHAQNMTRLLKIVESVYETSHPEFGVLNSELHISIDRSRDKLLKGELPYGNDFVIVGRQLLMELDVEQLRKQSLPYKVLSDGGVLIQFNNKWA